MPFYQGMQNTSALFFQCWPGSQWHHVPVRLWSPATISPQPSANNWLIGKQKLCAREHTHTCPPTPTPNRETSACCRCSKSAPETTSVLNCFPCPILSLPFSWRALPQSPLPKNLWPSSASGDPDRGAMLSKNLRFLRPSCNCHFFPSGWGRESKACHRYQSQGCRALDCLPPSFLLTTCSPQT